MAVSLEQPVDACLFQTIFQAEHIDYKEYEERGGVDGGRVPLPDAVHHVAKHEEHGDEHGVAYGGVADAEGLPVLVLAQGEDNHQRPHHHQQLGAFPVENEVGVRHPSRHQQDEGQEQGEGYDEIAQGAAKCR